MNGLEVVLGGTGGGVFLYPTRHAEPATVEVRKYKGREEKWETEEKAIKIQRTERKMQVSDNVERSQQSIDAEHTFLASSMQRAAPNQSTLIASVSYSKSQEEHHNTDWKIMKKEGRSFQKASHTDRTTEVEWHSEVLFYIEGPDKATS